MEKTWILFAVMMGGLLLPAHNARADTWARGVSEAGGWFDAEKDNVRDRTSPWPYHDDLMLCWAASAADVLMWSGWNAGYANEDEIFDFFTSQDAYNGGSEQYHAWKFWFDGTQSYDPTLGRTNLAHNQVHFSGSSHAGYYTTAQFDAAYIEYDTDRSLMMSEAASLLDADYGVGLRLSGPHAITLWGIKTDPTTGDYLGVWVTDSDNNSNGPDPRLNTLDYYGVSLISGNWCLDDYMWGPLYITDIEALRLRPVPVPPAALLGLLGFAAAGWRLRRHGALHCCSHDDSGTGRQGV